MIAASIEGVTMYSPHLETLHDDLMPIMHQAEKLLLEGYYGAVDISWKSTGEEWHIVTDVDKRIDTFLRNALRAQFPHIGLITEEQDNSGVEEWNWIIDPIDGTLNFSKKIPLFGISIALWHENQPIYGQISFPMQRDRYYALRDRGTYLNGNRLIGPHKLSKKPYFIFAYHGDNKLLLLNSLIDKLQVFPRSFDSACYEGCLVAAGRADAAIFCGQAIWDIAALIPLIQEVGREVLFLSPWPDLNASESRDYRHCLLIGDPSFLPRISPLVRQHSGYC